MRLTRFWRLLVVVALAPLALGGAFGHVDGFETLSHGTFLFPPDHPAHAPFVPEKEHPCAACAVGHPPPPAPPPPLCPPPRPGSRSVLSRPPRPRPRGPRADQDGPERKQER